MVSSVTKRSDRTLLLALLGVALVIHVASALAVFELRPESISTIPDPLDYRVAALNLIHHGTFSLVSPELNAPELLRTPAYPLIVAAGYLIDGETGLAVILLQSVLLVAMGYLLYVFLTALYIPSRLALLLTAVYLFEPFQWLYTLHTMTETVTSFLLLAILTIAVAGKGLTRFSHVGLFGICLGLLVFVKPSATMWAPFLLFLVVLVPGDWRVRIARLVLAAVCTVVVLVPWVLRNHELTGAYIVSSSGPYNLIYFAGDQETTPTRYNEVLETITYNGHEKQFWYAYTVDAYPMLLAANEAILEEESLLSLGLRQLQCSPNVWFGFLFPKNQESFGHQYSMITQFVAGEHALRDTVINIIDVLLWSATLVLSFIGTAALVVDRRTRWMSVSLVGMLLATVLVNFCASWTRVLIPLYPVILLTAGAGVLLLWRLLTARKDTV